MAEGAGAKTVDVLIASPRQDFWDSIQTILQGYYPYKMKFFKSVDEILDSPADDFQPLLSLLDGQGGTEIASEWAQSIKMTFPSTSILVLHASDSGIDFENVKKNGASELMHSSYDREFISDMVLHLAPIDMEGEHIPITALMPVDLRDLEADSEINFDIYVHLPANQKTVLFRKAGAQIDEKMIGKFAQSQQNMYIKKTQMKAFFEYARTMLSARNISVPVSMTEKFQKSKKSIFAIMANFMNSATGDFQEGRRIMAECLSIIESFELTQDRETRSLFNEICRFAGNTRTTYHDAISIAAFAAFFAQLLGFPEEQRKNAALAGLLHNIGLAQIPPSITSKKEAEMSVEEIKTYQTYPDRSVNMVKMKKVSLNPEISAAMGQHREMGNGKGFPQALIAADIEPLSKILILAYHFHRMTALENKIVSCTPNVAIQQIRDNAISGDSIFDLIFAKKLHEKINSL